MYSESQTQSMPNGSDDPSSAGPSDVAPQQCPDDARRDDYIRSTFPVAYHRGEIFAAYKDGLVSIFATATACLAAEAELAPGEKQALFERTSFPAAELL
ncbi:hypothetical protein ACVWZL_007352 [Bradyrhizobium sp. GM2.4]